MPYRGVGQSCGVSTLKATADFWKLNWGWVQDLAINRSMIICGFDALLLTIAEYHIIVQQATSTSATHQRFPKGKYERPVISHAKCFDGLGAYHGPSSGTQTEETFQYISSICVAIGSGRDVLVYFQCVRRYWQGNMWRSKEKTRVVEERVVRMDICPLMKFSTIKYYRRCRRESLVRAMSHPYAFLNI